MKLETILKSKGLYYVALVLMVVNILGYVSVGSVECIIVFAITYYLSNSYTKNQSVDILVGLFVSNVVFGCGRVREGFETPTAKLNAGAAQSLTQARDLTKKACAPGQERDKKGKCVAAAKAAAAAAQTASKAAAQSDHADKLLQ